MLRHSLCIDPYTLTFYQNRIYLNALNLLRREGENALITHDLLDDLKASYNRKCWSIKENV